ncbi:MAG: hypothetical protein C4547_12500 [Phycisphaerales bacterium]|nr:MAG: hypothetical protein C4547_12500 [Phycisphaerales bacterium]
MARLFSSPRRHLRILDAGAGIGILSAAICDRVLTLPVPRSLHLVLFETDARVLPLLDENLRRCRDALRQAGHELSYSIEQTDFVLANRPACGQETLFEDPREHVEFDAAIMNPPYFKLNKQSAHARAFECIIRGQPNIYALFMATAAAMLRPGGELVAITPRSFCSGLYFRGFRRWFLQRMALRYIHLFDSRTDAFRGADVLQESLVTRFDKASPDGKTIRFSTSHGADLQGAHDVVEYRSSWIIDDTGGDLVIRIPAARIDARIMKVVDSWPARFAEHGLQISTGPVVTFRATRYLLSTADHPDGVPLIFPHNVHPFDTRWPVRKNGKPLALRSCPDSEKFLLPTRNYVLLRRFSARKHVVCEIARLSALGIVVTQHDKLPDIVLHWSDRNWLFLIEAVTTHGPVSPERHREIETMLRSCPAERIYVTAFLNMGAFRRYAGDIACETEEWIADNPDQMVHLNEPKFLGPYKRH